VIYPLPGALRIHFDRRAPADRHAAPSVTARGAQLRHGIARDPRGAEGTEPGTWGGRGPGSASS